MSKTHQKRLFMIVFLIVGSAIAAGLILKAFSNNIDLYYTPTDYQQMTLPSDKIIRVGGMVVKGSVERDADLQVRFRITDFENELTVQYEGILPDLFREGQGVVILGRQQSANALQATQVLAKHDENYMPPEVARQMRSAPSDTPKAGEA